MTAAIQFLIDVLSLGGAYALMALGLVIVYGILRLVNFAYGELIMVAGYTLFLVGGTPLPWLVMAVAAVLAAVLTGIATDYVAFRPVREKSVTAVLITSFAFSTLLQNAALLFISPRPRNVPMPDIFSDTIQNFSALPVRRVDRTAQLAGEVDTFEAIARFRAALAMIPNVAEEPPPQVSLLELNLVGPVIAVRPYTSSANYWQVFFDTNEAIVKVCRDAGWPAPTPSQIVRQVQATAPAAVPAARTSS